MKDNQRSNIVLIGMPGVGKSTIGVLLAKALSLDFLDTDVVIQSREQTRLQDIIDHRGWEQFCAIEENHILGVDAQNTVIATGGSVVYGSRAMDHLARDGVIVHLDLDLPAIEKRITNLDSRGVVRPKDMSLQELYTHRQELYRQYAEVTIDCNGLDHQQTLDAVIAHIGV